MNDISRYHIIMKVLEIIEIDQIGGTIKVSPSDRAKAITIIERIEGNLTFNQVSGEEMNVDIKGDHFENISNSTIATRGSIAKSLILIRETDGAEVVDALTQLDQALAGLDPEKIPKEQVERAIELLGELIKQATSANRSKSIVEVIGNGLWEAIKNFDAISKVIAASWPIIKRLWI